MEKWNINNGGSLFRLTNANISTNYSFSNKDKKDKNKDKKQTDGYCSWSRTDDLFGSSKPLSEVQDMDKNRKESEDKEEKKPTIKRLYLGILLLHTHLLIVIKHVKVLYLIIL